MNRALVESMLAEAEKLERRADGFRMAGEANDARRYREASRALKYAIQHMEGLK